MKKMILFFSLVFVTSSYAETITLSMTAVIKKTRLTRITKAALENVGKKIGVRFRLEVLPGKRADFLIKSGDIDGDIGRIFEFGQKHRNLIRVGEPAIVLPYYAFTTEKIFKVKGWKSLEPYSVVYVAGSSFVEANLKPIHKRLYPIGSPKQALLFLSAGRADLHISTPLVLSEFIGSGELKKLKIKALGPPIAHLKLYTYFQPRHSQIAKKYMIALKRIKKSGVYDRIINTTM